jgi:hypothetical protein
MSQISKIVGSRFIWFILTTFLIGATLAWADSRSYLGLYLYAPWLFSTSPTPPDSQLLGKESIVDRECHLTWIRGYYATSTPWDQVIALYRSNGFRGSGNTPQMLVHHKDTSNQIVTNIHQVGEILIDDTQVRDAVMSTISSGQNVYGFYSRYIDDKEGYAQCRRARD